MMQMMVAIRNSSIGRKARACIAEVAGFVLSLVVIVLVGLLLALASPGCVALDPGGQVARGVGQTKTYGWDEAGNFTVTGQGAQTERFTMAQGAILMMPGPDGLPVIDYENSRLEYFLTADPSAESAASVMGPAFEASTAQVRVLAGELGKALQLVTALLEKTMAVPAAEPVE